MTVDKPPEPKPSFITKGSEGLNPSYVGDPNLYWQGGFDDYLRILLDRSSVAHTAHERLWAMIQWFGSETYEDPERRGENIIHYKLFDDAIRGGKNAIFGLDIPIMNFCAVVQGASLRYGAERRVLLLHGPVGGAKSTIVTSLKHGLEDYSRTDEGALYGLGWPGKFVGDKEPEFVWCPMHQEPLLVIPKDVRRQFLLNLSPSLSGVSIEGDLCPLCRLIFNERLRHHRGDWQKVLGEVLVRRVIISEHDRVCLGTFQPKDEKNQDSTELTGDLNYRKIAEYGSDSDPRAFNFDGEFNVANRGLMEFIEVLKLDVAFLYDLLGASQEHKIKPKKFAQTDIDEVIIGHTNEPEYRKLVSNEFMGALRDRTIKIDIPYSTRLSHEIKIYKRDYNKIKIDPKQKHIAPHTLEVGAMFVVLSRLSEPKKANLTRLQKLKLYNGKSLHGFTADSILELRNEQPNEGMSGVSPRYVQDKLGNVLVVSGVSCVNPFMLLTEIERGLPGLADSTKKRDEVLADWRNQLGVVKEEYEDVVKNEVQRAIAADEEALARLCGNYIDNVRAYTLKETVRNKFTGQAEDPDERLMRSIEEKIDIPDSRKDDFRREIMNYIGALAIDGKRFDYKTNERLMKALELKLFDDQKDTIKLTNLVSSVVDEKTQEKIDVVKGRLINDYGYCEVCATDVLNYVASIFARGDVKK